MNIQHSSRSDRWFTPQSVIGLVHATIGEIDLDPCSEHLANETVKAARYYTHDDDGLTQRWQATTVYCNPPGGKSGRESRVVQWWRHAMDQRKNYSHMIFMAFSIESLQTTQQVSPCMLDFAMCVPRKRIAFRHPTGMVGHSPSHANIIIYVPGLDALPLNAAFASNFKSLGHVICPNK